MAKNSSKKEKVQDSLKEVKDTAEEAVQDSLKEEKENAKAAAKEAKETAKSAPKKAKESSQASKKKEPGKIRKWFRDLKIEFKKVVWPTKKTVANNTSVVVGVIVLSAAVVGALDEGFLALFRAIYH
ncbi:MAG: preprotein translocase subunit SecE [Ruminococcus sp.]|nr:preprotein translocase subunit SecE [Ruminococcus sp.]